MNVWDGTKRNGGSQPNCLSVVLAAVAVVVIGVLALI